MTAVTGLRALIVVAIGAPSIAVSVSHADAQLLFRLADSRIGEASGLAAGVASPGVFYVVNDSGDRNRIFAVRSASSSSFCSVISPQEPAIR